MECLTKVQADVKCKRSEGKKINGSKALVRLSFSGRCDVMLSTENNFYFYWPNCFYFQFSVQFHTPMTNSTEK